MLTSDFDYELPESAIAQQALAERGASRLCVADVPSSRLTHSRFSELPSFLEKGDLLVLNNTKVLPARIPCLREGGGPMEVFLLNPPGGGPPSASPEPGRRFRAFLKPGRRAKAGMKLRCALAEGGFEVVAPQGSAEHAEVLWTGTDPLGAEGLARVGLAPLPPYIRRDAAPSEAERERDRERYQTVYASLPGSVAAPTAGLHFDEALKARLAAQGVGFVELTLHVGAGTFLPVKTGTLEEHPMHEESFHLSESSAQTLLQARQAGRRIIPVGTTSLRALESAALQGLFERPGWSQTRLFIKPGFQFQFARGLITNFHQPRSTLLALVSAFYDREKLLNAYRECLALGYRFLSYGDAMFLRH